MKKQILLISLLFVCSGLQAGKAFPGVSYKPSRGVVQKVNPATYDFNKPITLSKDGVVKLFVNGVGANPTAANAYTYDKGYFQGRNVTEKAGKKALGGMKYLRLRALKSTGNGMTQIQVSTGGKTKIIQVIIN